MKRFQPLVFSAALLFLAACGQNTQPEAAAPSFNFSIDPGSETVNLTSADAAALSALQLGACGEDEPRILFPDEELALTSYDAVFLPGNILEITAEFTNVTDFTFEQPFTFTRADSTSNIVSSQEPEVTDADLGGDGELSPGETTSTLTFTVEHMGQPFTYEVFAEAVVRCGGDDGEEPGEPGEPGEPVDPVDPVDPDGADLEVVKTGLAEVTLGADGSATLDFNVVVTNNGGVAAEGVVLTDTLTIDLADLVGVEATITAGTPLPEGCIVDADVAGGNVLICTIGTLEAGASANFDLSFDLALLGDLTGVTSITVTNTAEVITDTGESNLDNNIDAEVTVLVPEAPVVPEVADLVVTKTGTAEVVLDANGDATLDFAVNVTNNGTVAAEGVVLTDTLVIDLAGLAGVTADLTAINLPAGCIIDAAVLDAEVLICTLDPLAAGGTTNLGFTFAVDLAGDLAAITGPIAVTNTADATTTTGEDVLDNNIAVVETTLTAAPVVAPALADLAVTKTGDTEVTTGADGTATLDFTVVVTNEGDAIAEGFELMDTFAIDLSALGGTATLDATVLPTGCILSAEATAPNTLVAICTLDALAAGGTSTLDFTFAVDLPADVAPGSLVTVANTAEATTTTDETDVADNTATATATLTVPL